MEPELFNPATMNPASIILPSIETFSSNDMNYIDYIIIIMFIILFVLVYLRLSHKI